MPVDEVAEGFFRIAWRFVAYFLVDLVFEIGCYWLGWITLKIITIGKYPPPADHEHADWFVSLVGIIVVIALGLGSFIEVGEF